MVDLTHIQIPSDIPAKIRGESLDAGAVAQRDSNLDFLNKQLNAALDNLGASHGSFCGKTDHDITIVGASARAFNAICSIVSGGPVMSAAKGASRSK